MCTVSRLERQFATLYLFHAPTCMPFAGCGKGKSFPASEKGEAEPGDLKCLTNGFHKASIPAFAHRGMLAAPQSPGGKVPTKPGFERNLLSGKEKTHKHKQICGIVPGLGGCQKFVYAFFFRVIPYGGEKKHINKIPPKFRDNPVKILFMCFVLYVFFSLPILLLLLLPLRTTAA